MIETHEKRLFKALLKDNALNMKKVARMFQLGETYFSKAERAKKTMLGLIRFAESTSELGVPWKKCESCNYRNLASDVDEKYKNEINQEKIFCLKCKEKLYPLEEY